jgi:hypothetical protein
MRKCPFLPSAQPLVAKLLFETESAVPGYQMPGLRLKSTSLKDFIR